MTTPGDPDEVAASDASDFMAGLLAIALEAIPEERRAAFLEDLRAYARAEADPGDDL